MFDDEINNPQPLSKNGLKVCTWIVFAGVVFLSALMLTADKPAHETECTADTLTCSQEVAP